MLTVCYNGAHLFSSVQFLVLALHQHEQLCHLQQSPVPLQFPLSYMVIVTDAMPSHLSLYIQGPGFHYQVVDPGQVLCVRLILPSKNFRQL